MQSKRMIKGKDSFPHFSKEGRNKSKHGLVGDNSYNSQENKRK
jgi:hypothetical protein